MSDHREAALPNHLLLEGLSNGSPTAARQFHLRYSARISRCVWRLLGTDHEHDDVVQQVYVNVLDSMNRIHNPEALDTWVDSVTVKTVRYEIRKRKVRRLLWGKPPQTSDDVVDCRDNSSAFKQSHIRKFYEILDSMPANDRIILSLRFLEGYSVGEIAVVGNYSMSTAKRRLKKAKSLFVKKVLQDFSLISLVEECHAT